MKQIGNMKLYSLDEILDEDMGKIGTPERDAFEAEVQADIHAYKIGEAIKKARLSQHLTQEQLGERLGVQRAQISRLLLMIEYRTETLRRLIVALVLHVFKIERGASSRRERNCLYCEQESGIADTCCHLCEAKNLQTPFYSAGTARPVPVNPRSLLPGLMQKAVAKCYGCPAIAFPQKNTAVESAPVELFFEVLPEATLARISMPRHRQEIKFSVYGQYQNHCLSEETFEIFSYFCSPIERICDNRPYLVKWLKHIRNYLICNHKDTKNLALDQILLVLILLKINKFNMFYSIFFKSKKLTNYCC